MNQLTKLGVAFVIFTAGCTIREETIPPSAEVEVDTVPPTIEASPHVVYRGRDVYYYGGYWYYRHGPRWVYMREEPGELHAYRQRRRIGVQAAPPAYDYRR
jgi:hypothetical protein